MRIEIRSRGLKLTKEQTLRLRQDLGIVFARVGERVDRVIVAISTLDKIGGPCCEIEVRVKPKPVKVVKVVSSDRDVEVAIEHAAKRAVRSVSRAIDIEELVRR